MPGVQSWGFGSVLCACVCMLSFHHSGKVQVPKGQFQALGARWAEKLCDCSGSGRKGRKILECIGEGWLGVRPEIRRPCSCMTCSISSHRWSYTGVCSCIYSEEEEGRDQSRGEG